MNKKIQSIEVDTHYQNGNWAPLLKQVKNKRIVLLGELNHGSREIFLSRNRRTAEYKVGSIRRLIRSRGGITREAYS